MKKLLSLTFLTGLLVSVAGRAYATTLTIPTPKFFPNYEIGNIIVAVAELLLIVAAIAAFLFLIIGGLQWITSGGDKAGMEAARNRITAAIIGLIIVAAAWAIMLLVGEFIGVNILSGGLELPTMQNP